MPVEIAAQATAPPSDEELVRRCRARDESAVRELTRRYNQRLYRIARGILRNDADAEDVVQETYLRAFTHLAAFRGDASIGTWLVRIAMNDAYGRLRRARPTVDIEEARVAEAGNDPESTMAQSELRTMLERSIDELPDAFRAVFVARLVEGLSVEETATLFGIRPETVKTRVHRARRRMRVALERQLGEAVPTAFSFEGARCQRLTEEVLRKLEVRSQKLEV